MIQRVWSDLHGFREVSLQGGMNIILADRAEDSDETESTNGLGKTTFLRIIHFCLGSDLARDKVLSHPGLEGVTFGLDFEFDDTPHSVRRNTSTAKSVTVDRAFIDGLPYEYEAAPGDLAIVSLETWKTVLSKRYYPETEEPAGSGHFEPSFRDIAGYLMRVGKSAYVDPLIAFQNQPGASKRLTASFLLGLNWAEQRKLKADLAAKAQVKEATKALRAIDMEADHKTLGDLEAERVAHDGLISAKKVEVESFNVRPDYRELEQKLQDLDREIHTFINENYSAARLQEFYEQSSQELPAADAERPLAILRDAGAVFKEDALQSIEDVSAFHRELYRNRKAFLASEIQRLTAEIEQRKQIIDRLSSEKQRILGVLKSSGALETLIELQRSYTDLVARHRALVALIEERRRFDKRDDELTIKISHTKALLKRDLEDRQKFVDEVRSLFATYTTVLYGKPGKLSVDVGKEGYSLSFSIEREGSDGVDQMVVFCFDLTVASIWAKRKRGFGVLAHDSTLFADVDPRQYAAALKLAQDKAAALGFQYICCLNSGSIPEERLGDWKLDEFVRLRLTDQGPQGRLLGKLLPPREKVAAA